MILGSVKKQTRERFKVGIDCTNRLVDDETIVGATVTARTKAGIDATADILVGSHEIDGAVVNSPIIHEGVSRVVYFIDFLIETSAGNKYEAEVIVPIQDV